MSFALNGRRLAKFQPQISEFSKMMKHQMFEVMFSKKKKKLKLITFFFFSTLLFLSCTEIRKTN